MWNKTFFFKIWVDVKERKGRCIVIPLLLQTQCLSSYLDDLADVALLLPKDIIVGEKPGNKAMTMSVCSGMLRSVADILNDMSGFYTKVKVRSHKDGDVTVDIRAI